MESRVYSEGHDGRWGTIVIEPHATRLRDSWCWAYRCAAEIIEQGHALPNSVSVTSSGIERPARVTVRYAVESREPWAGPRLKVALESLAARIGGG
jgi:hypothetical protein